MRKQSKSLEDTVLWNVYKKRMSSDMVRTGWLEKVYQASAAYLKDVRQTFKNYTLHDEIHILNVLDAMAGLLGDCIENLTDAEMELLILAASLHDIGMVYTEEEIIFSLEDEEKCRGFLRENHPELLGCEPKNWPEDIRQWYLRTRHPFRISEVLLHTEWKNLFEERPAEIVSKRCILAVCQAHGEKPEDLCTSQYLKYQAASEADPLFCALLLRLADLLDFDDTRAPGVLYSYVEDNEKSRAEWDKHQSSAGFRYLQSPSVKELPYKACCKNPAVEHAVRKFLDWVDDELDNCARLQRYCHASWQKEFPFPRAVLRSEIESDGYMSGDFCLSMNQEQVLKLLTGENLYDNRDVFVRELLQNAVDATLLRSEMDSAFVPEDARIDIWEWSDREGNFWFRIDDQGTGMTLGMLKRYFLKVGSSYYTSQELKRDLLDHEKTDDFYGISRFGIGFLSCFLCGDYAEVSTLYFDPQKNRREEPYQRSMQTVHYGLRLQLTGLSGYYMLKNQVEEHIAESPLPMPDFYDDGKQTGVERFGYRIKPGTSIVIRMIPGKLGALDLRGSVKKYLCGTKMPVYYNGRRIGRTYDEAVQIIHKMAGENFYELDLETKKRFDECFPAIRGNYPKLVQTVIPLDIEENQILDGLLGVIVKHHIIFEKEPQWTGKDQKYEVRYNIEWTEKESRIELISQNTRESLVFDKIKDSFSRVEWIDLECKFGNTELLAKKFETLEKCPITDDILGDMWLPFSTKVDLPLAWTAFINFVHEKRMCFGIEKYGYISLNSVFDNIQSIGPKYVYQGIIVGQRLEKYCSKDKNITVFFLGREWRPKLEISRSKMKDMHLILKMAIYNILMKYDLLYSDQGEFLLEMLKWEKITLYEWRKVRDSSVGRWIKQNHNETIEDFMEYLKEPFSLFRRPHRFYIMDTYFAAYLQDNFSMTISYEDGQKIEFYNKKRDNYENAYDIFPALIFCKAASEKSRKYICHAKFFNRRGITSDHPFIIWMLENAIELKEHFQRQFLQLVECLCNKDGDDIIQIYNDICEQIYFTSNRYGLDAELLPQLSMSDFLTSEKEKEYEEEKKYEEEEKDWLLDLLEDDLIFEQI